MITPELAIARIQEFRLHPLGFFYLRFDEGDGTSSRFHIWPTKEFGTPENECHQHRFDIRSTVLSGHMRSQLFNFESGPRGDQKEFAVEYDGTESVLRPTGRSGSLDRFCEFDSKDGDTYFLKAGVIHKVSVVRRPCVTTLQTFDRAIDIFSYGEDSAEAPFNRRRVVDAEIREVESILRSLPKQVRDGG